MSKLHLYTAKVVSKKLFEDSASVLMVLKAQNGKAIKDIWVSKSFKLDTPVLDKIDKGAEIAFAAEGRSKEPYRETEQGLGIHALVGMDMASINVILPGEVVAVEEEADEKTQKQRKGLLSRTISFLDAMASAQKATK